MAQCNRMQHDCETSLDWPLKCTQTWHNATECNMRHNCFKLSACSQHIYSKLLCAHVTYQNSYTNKWIICICEAVRWN